VSLVDYNVVAERPVAAPETPGNGNPGAREERTCARKVFIRRVRAKDVCRLVRQLAALLHAGMPLVPALSALVEQLEEVPRRAWAAKDDPLVLIVRDVRDAVNEGSTLSSALARHPQAFSSLFVNMVAAGEAGGTLEDVLLRLAQMLEKRIHLAGKVKSVIAYPAMMTFVAVGVVVFLLSYVVPSITQIFLEMNRVLPWPTRLLISTCDLIRTYWMLPPVIVCALFFAVTAWVRTEKGRIGWDRSKLKVPLFGGLFLKLEIARLARTLAALLVSGIPILGALEIVKGVVQNRFIGAALDSVKDLVGKGHNIADAVRQTRLFPPVVVHIIAIGQLSGNMESGLMDIAEMYDNEVEMTARTLTSLLEPAILLVMGAVVGFIVLAVLLPVFEINQIL
jgi:general secretion pathway protein F